MAFLGIKLNKEKTGKVVKKTKKLAVSIAKSKVVSDKVSSASSADLASAIIVRPRVTEKATLQSERDPRVYVFEVASAATKATVANAINALYKIVPEKVRIVNTKRSRVFVRGKRGHTVGFKKAYVYLKKGDKLEII